MEKVAATNRALLAAGLLELIPWNRVVPYPCSATTTVLLYRFAPDDEPLPTAYTTELWNRLVPAINADLHHTFPKIVRMVQTAPVFGDAFLIPDQTRSVARELRAQAFFDSRGDSFAEGKIPRFTKNVWLCRMIERHLQEVVLAQEKIVTDERTKCLLGLVYTCGLLPFLFKDPGACAERRIRCLCDFGVTSAFSRKPRSETPMPIFAGGKRADR